MEPRVSVSQITTVRSSFADDVRLYAEAGLDGVGVWELKLGDDGDGESLELLAESGLASAAAVPAIPSILPLPLLGGPDDEEEIVRATDYGVYVAELGGGQVNPATGDFVFGMLEAYLIENGEITVPLREGNLIGNGPQVLRDIDMIAGDFAMGRPGTCGKDGQGVPVGDGCPTLRVSALTVGGTAA